MDKTIDSSFSQQDMRVVFAGHVDHGKSTVIGRLLVDSHSLPEGKLEQVKEKCRKTARPFEYAFLLDALKEEQAQGITIDSARCFFKTKNKNYILIDAPGHTEFIKNMVSGASRADAAVLVIDALEGVKDNTKRHGVYLSLLGIEQVCILINKMDLVGYSQNRFEEIKQEYIEFLQGMSLEPMAFIPISGFLGDNIVNHSKNMTWYNECTLLETLELFKSQQETAEKPFRMPIQDIYKFTGDGDQRRIIAGTVDSGTLNIGDELIFYPSEKKSKVKSIECFSKERVNRVTAGNATGFTLEEQIFLQRGEIATKSGEEPPLVGKYIKTRLFWLGKRPIIEGSKYLFKIGTTKIGVKIEKILSAMDATSIDIFTKNRIERHEIADCILMLDKEIAFDTVKGFPNTSRFVIVEDYDISGGGVILERLQGFSPTSEKYLSTEKGKVSYEERCKMLGQCGIVLWFTGLSGAGKSTIAIELERQLIDRGKLSFRLDGDNIRDGLNSDLGFSIVERDENIRRISETAKLFKESGMITLVSFISPLRSMREKAKNIIGERDFIEIYVKASFETCLARDAKGLYSKAMEGKIKNFTGVSSRYEEPDCPDLILDTEQNDVKTCVEQVVSYLDNYFNQSEVEKK